MAPTRGGQKGSKLKSKGPFKPQQPSSASNKKKQKSSKKTPNKLAISKERKSRRPGHVKPKKRREYTEAELDLPKLNTVTPAGVQKPKGKKKGKVFVDDPESMKTILAIVNAEKEGQIESKMMKARQMEEIRQARQEEMEARQEEKKNKLVDKSGLTEDDPVLTSSQEDAKEALRRKGKANLDAAGVQENGVKGRQKPQRKRVSFG